MKNPTVYVVQVLGGRESAACELIASQLADVIRECYTPSYEAMRKGKMGWERVQKVLFPGYVFVDTAEPQLLLKRLGGVRGFTRLLGVSDQKFTPLSASDLAWLEAFTDVDTHVAAMSEGVIEGDRVLVTKGPLKGHEAQITKIDRHKRVAYLAVHILGRDKEIKVGLEIVRKS